MTDDVPVDPVEKRNRDDERQVAELAALDMRLDDEQQRLDQLAHDDLVGFVWFADDDAWLDKRLGKSTE